MKISVHLPQKGSIPEAWYHSFLSFGTVEQAFLVIHDRGFTERATWLSPIFLQILYNKSEFRLFTAIYIHVSLRILPAICFGGTITCHSKIFVLDKRPVQIVILKTTPAIRKQNKKSIM